MSSTALILSALGVVTAVIVIAIKSWYSVRFFNYATAGANTGVNENADRAREIGSSTIIIGTWIIGFAAAGFMIIGAWSYGQPVPADKNSAAWSIFAIDAMIASAASAVGALLGFIFGVPRTLDPSTRVAVVAASQPGSPVAGSQAALAANTNLERISDWFTTLLIGATLAQSERVIKWLETLGSKIQTTGQPIENSAMIPIIVIYFFALAFLGTYLVTRLYLTFALQQTLALLTGASSSVLKIITTTLPNGTANTAYASTKLQAIGGTSPLNWSVQPTLPAGLTLDAVTGAISGTPTAATAKTTYVVTATDGATPPISAASSIDLEIK